MLTQAVHAADNSCVRCHQDTWEEIKNSIHSRHGVLCQDCHGGDPSKPDQESAMSPAAGYIGIPDKKQIVQKCGECHANVEVMNFYGIRTDQLARYQTSMHGKKLFEGDNRVAACSDCHGYHEVLAVEDPNSSVYPLNLPQTCNRCHGNAKLMDHYRLPADIYEVYRASVHGKALFEKKDLSVANCASCHGSHGAVPPGVREVGATCGKCHVNEKKFFLESVHAKISEEGKFSECISCHGHHGVQHATNDLYETTCVKCHTGESKAAQEGKRILAAFVNSEQSVRSASDRIREASIKGIFVEDEEALLEEAKTNFIAMAPAQHSLAYEKISGFHEKLTANTASIEDSIEKKQRNLKWRKVALIPVWILIVVMVIALWTKYKRLQFWRQGRKGHPHE